MSLDAKIMQMLDRFATMDAESPVKDEYALDYINNIQVPQDKPFLKNEYKNYYFRAKRHYREEQEEKGYGHGV